MKLIYLTLVLLITSCAATTNYTPSEKPVSYTQNDSAYDVQIRYDSISYDALQSIFLSRIYNTTDTSDRKTLIADFQELTGESFSAVHSRMILKQFDGRYAIADKSIELKDGYLGDQPIKFLQPSTLILPYEGSELFFNITDSIKTASYKGEIVELVKLE